jgi:nucleotide-binding universal stress UspA family protein
MNAKNILCPYDYSENSRVALSYASALARESSATVHLLHVTQPITPTDTGFGGYAPAPIDLEALQQELEKIKPIGEGLECKRDVRIGAAAASIVEYAKENEMDIIVMGTHGRTGLTRLLMGSVAEAVVRGAECPVITVKQPVKETQPA